MPPLRLEVFETDTQSATDPIVTDQEALEEARLAAYEQGYGAGWEDASSAQSDDQARMRADLAHNLQGLGFTFHEARVHVLRAMEPLLTDMVARVLPQAARAALAPLIVETLLPLAAAAAEAPVLLVFNPAAREAIEAVVDQHAGLPMLLSEEPTLGEGQVYLRLGEVETRIDLDAAIGQIAAATRDFFQLSRKEVPHG